MNITHDGDSGFTPTPGPWKVEYGMSPRDWFAGQALNGLVRAMTDAHGTWNPAVVATEAYELADAMLAAREKR